MFVLCSWVGARRTRHGGVAEREIFRKFSLRRTFRESFVRRFLLRGSPFLQQESVGIGLHHGSQKKSKKSFRKVLTDPNGFSFMEVFLASEKGAAFFESYSVRLGGSIEPVNPLNNNCATVFCRGTRDLMVTHSSQSELGR